MHFGLAFGPQTVPSPPLLAADELPSLCAAEHARGAPVTKHLVARALRAPREKRSSLNCTPEGFRIPNNDAAVIEQQ